MSIFDNLDPEQIAQMMNRQFGEGSAQSVMGAQQQQQQPPTLPEPPPVSSEGDVSGFANYGMQPPTLPQMPGVPDMSQAASPVSNPMQGIGGIMALTGKPQQGSAPSQQQLGGLMAYLQSLGV